jgi:hypothetical protein
MEEYTKRMIQIYMHRKKEEGETEGEWYLYAHKGVCVTGSC